MVEDKFTPKLKKLLKKKLNTFEAAEKFLLEKSQILSEFEEALAWAYINYTRNTENYEYQDIYFHFAYNLSPDIKELNKKLNEKLAKSKFIDKLEKKYPTVIRSLKNQIKLTNEKVIKLEAKEDILSMRYGEIAGKLTIKYKGKTYTLQQASKFLYDKNRNIRRKVYKLINDKRLKVKDKLNDLLNKLIKIRHSIAQEAGFDNYRDFKHKKLDRFDYSVEDVLKFHNVVKESILPLIDEVMTIRKDKLKVEELKPWDLRVDIERKPPITAFKDTNDFIEKTIKTLSHIKKQYGDFLKIMKEKGYLDLESRKGKAPGGYNYPLYQSNIPFIFMNASGTLRDVVTLFHESGHAIHSFLTKDLPLMELKETPSEVAELASMSMELISMEHWDVFFEDKELTKRAKRQHLEDIISILAWIVIVDKFQHWLYTNPSHNTIERYIAWSEIYQEFSSKILNWETIEFYNFNLWQKQLHIFEVPFYYIEYAFAQLGAIAIWKNYKKNPQKTLEQYEAALKLGYTKTIPEIYKTAGIDFDFSKDYVKKLLNFVLNEYKKLID